MKIEISDMNEFADALFKSGKRCGPRYTGQSGNPPLRWGDSYFERDIQPVGTVNCRQALRVGSTNNGLDVVVVASPSNETELAIPAGSTITLTLLQADEKDGTYEDVGPSLCVKAPDAGLKAAPDCTVARFPIGNFSKPWLMVTLEFSGAISGGTVDCSLAYMPR